MKLVTWQRHGDGYEVSSKGDNRFSAFYAFLPDGYSIERAYQCRVKGYKTVREGKGRPPLRKDVNLFEEYLKLWRTYLEAHPELLDDLTEKAKQHNYLLTDMFATTRVNQAHALSVLINEKLEKDTAQQELSVERHPKRDDVVS